MPYIYTLKNPAYREPKGNAIPFKQWKRENAPVISVLRPPSKRSAKHDRVAIMYCRQHGIKPATHDPLALKSAGLASSVKQF